MALVLSACLLPCPSIWEPVDIDATPTADQLKDAKPGFLKVGGVFESAKLAEVPTQPRVAELDTDLAKRRAWIAPIRRLNFDVLSLIFEYCAEDKWNAPLQIAAVSTSWRAVVLATSRAWTFIDINTEYLPSVENLGIYLERSGQRLLHIGLHRKAYSGRITFLPSIAHRIQCLSILGSTWELDGVILPSLTKLTVHGEEAVRRISDTQFPRLTHLRFCEALLDSGYSEETCRTLIPNFPALRKLEMPVVMDDGWLDVLYTCRNSLTSLVLVIHEPYRWQSECSIILPALISLSFLCRPYYISHPDIPRLRLTTPALKTYIHDTLYKADRPPHDDLGTVTDASLSGGSVNLSHYRSIRRLKLHGRILCSKASSELAKDHTLCPSLEDIELLLNTGRFENVSFDESVVEELKVARPALRVLAFHRCDTPGYLDNFPYDDGTVKSFPRPLLCY